MLSLRIPCGSIAAVHTARPFKELIRRAIADLGKHPAILDECVAETNRGSETAVKKLEKRRQECSQNLSEVKREVHRLIAFIRSHDDVPKEIEEELQCLNKEKGDLEVQVEKLGVEMH